MMRNAALLDRHMHILPAYRRPQITTTTATTTTTTTAATTTTTTTSEALSQQECVDFDSNN